MNIEMILDVGKKNKQCVRDAKCLWGLHVTHIGSANTNPLFDTCKYDKEFTDGLNENHRENLISDNMFAQVKLEER